MSSSAPGAAAAAADVATKGHRKPDASSFSWAVAMIVVGVVVVGVYVYVYAPQNNVDFMMKMGWTQNPRSRKFNNKKKQVQISTVPTTSTIVTPNTAKPPNNGNLRLTALPPALLSKPQGYQPPAGAADAAGSASDAGAPRQNN